MFNIQMLNSISATGLEQFPNESYHIATDLQHPDAILVRSYRMHDVQIPASLLVVGRAGVGVNTIPVDVLTHQGIPVLNTPGANTNAVRELVIAGMIMASRHLFRAAEYVRELDIVEDASLEACVEKNKKNFVGTELRGKTLGVIGLGNIGVQVANAAAGLGMHILGYDPLITVEHAWQLSSEVKKIKQLDELLAHADYITLHIPLVPETHGMINADTLSKIKKSAVLLNFSRQNIVDEGALLDALTEKKLGFYVSDFPTISLKNHPQVVSLPHLGASTLEAEENCAMMIVRQVKNFLERGVINHSVNFPSIELIENSNCFRFSFVHHNIPGVVAHISTIFAVDKINIVSLQNGSRGDIAYTLVDVSQQPKGALLAQLNTIEGMIRVRQVI